MVAVHPFRALRYHADRVPSLSPVLAPPYDVIDPAEQERLYQASPYNIVRLILGKQSPADTEQDNRYTRAAREFAAWRRDRVLREDATPAFYVVQHAFEDAEGRPQSRLGFLGVLGLRELGERDVLPHEVTLSAPKQDRTKLLEAVPANLSPVFCVYPDAGGVLQARLQGLTAAMAPTAEGTLHGERIRLWAVTAPDAIGEISRRLSAVAVLIADGHHRFEVARSKRDRYGLLMSYFVSMAEPALRVRAIHRVVEPSGPVDLAALRRVCALEPARDVEDVLRWLQADGAAGRFGFVQGGKIYRATVLPAALAQWLAAPSVPAGLASLDVSLLHGLLLPILGVSPAQAVSGAASGPAVRYTADAGHAAASAGAGSRACAWLLRGIPLERVYALASEGLVLPPKSTYFYPKVPSGLALNPLV